MEAGSSSNPADKSVHDTDRYEFVKHIASGNFGVTKLMRNKRNGELVAAKFFERGEKIDENVQREIINHKSLRHPNIIRFKEVMLTPSHLAIVMEYAAGGELFEKIQKVGRFPEDEARFYFQQLISGVRYFHSMEVCHRDLKLENVLLDGGPVPRLKICDFGYSKSSGLDSEPTSGVGTPAYVAPEVFFKAKYDGKIADVWSCGVTLYVMLVGNYPFYDTESPDHNRAKMLKRMMQFTAYTLPDDVKLSMECRDLLSKIFVVNPAERITMADIENHPWFLKNLPCDIGAESANSTSELADSQFQTVDETMRIIAEARTPAASVSPFLDEHISDCYISSETELDRELDIDSSGEVYAFDLNT